MIRTLTRTLLFLALVISPIAALAQTPSANPATQPARHEGIGIGAKIGPLFSSLDQDSTSAGFEFKNRTGFIGGLFIGGNRPGIVGVGVDILYARRGGKPSFGDETLDLDYINVPVYARINAGSGNINKGAAVYGIVGLDLNFLLKARGFSVETDDFNRADYGLALGIGGEISRFIIEARYTKGFGNIAKDSDDPVTKNTSFAIMFGARFN